MMNRREALSYLTLGVAATALFPKEVLAQLVAEGEVLRHGDRDQPWVALTFDDGFLRPHVEKILTIADEYGLKFTFFPIGDRSLRRMADLWQYAVLTDHEIGNHSYTHRVLRTDRLSTEEIFWDIAHHQEALDEIIGEHVQVNFFRPPGGYVEPFVIQAANEQGFTVVNWSLSSGGTGARSTPDSSFYNVIKAVNGDIVLMHSIPNDTGRLREMIETLLGRGLEIVTLSHMFGLKPEKLPEEPPEENFLPEQPI